MLLSQNMIYNNSQIIKITNYENASKPPVTLHIVNNLRKMLLQKGFKPLYMLDYYSFD
jgi:hypothetical protein